MTPEDNRENENIEPKHRCEKCTAMREALLEINEEMKKYDMQRINAKELCRRIKGHISNAMKPVVWYKGLFTESEQGLFTESEQGEECQSRELYGENTTQLELARSIFTIARKYGMQTGRRIRGFLNVPDGRKFSLGLIGVDVDDWDGGRFMEFSLRINSTDFVETKIGDNHGKQ